MHGKKISLLAKKSEQLQISMKIIKDCHDGIKTEIGRFATFPIIHSFVN